MDVKAISGISSAPRFEGGMKKTANNESAQSYPQMSSPMSKDAAKAIENSAMISFGQKKRNHLRNAAIATGIGVMTLGSLTSCDKDLISTSSESWSATNSDAYAWAIGCPGKPVVIRDTVTVHDTDTIIKTVYEPIYVKEYPWHIADSLIAQGLNIGSELNGPVPKETENHVAFIGSTAYNEYDYSLYETKLDSIGTNAETMSLVTRVTKMYDDDDPTVSIDNPRISYIKTEITDVPGKGIQFTRMLMPASQLRAEDKTKFPKASDYRFNKYAGIEIRTNNRDGKHNTAHLYGRGDGLPEGREVEYLRGNKLGQFLYGTAVYDKDGNPYLDVDGNPEKAYYDFSDAKMVSTEVELVKMPDGKPTYYW